MRIEHVALWTGDIERLRQFYADAFGAMAGAPYTNTRTGFRSYFMSFAGGPRLELMARPDLSPRPAGTSVGWAHLALGVGTRADVDALVERLRARGVPVVSGPRVTGDGYYEAVVEDPDGNLVELCADA